MTSLVFIAGGYVALMALFGFWALVPIALHLSVMAAATAKR